MPSKDQWEIYMKEFIIGPPHTKRPRGRPKKKRIRGKDELEGRPKASKRLHKCTRCQGWGHHKNSCKQPINIRVAQQPSTQNSAASTQNQASR